MHLRRLRESQGLSMEELAERSGMSFRGIAYIEHGRRNPSLLSLLQIAAGLGIAPRRLLEFVPGSGDLGESRPSADV
ncbi:helix-turn-helix domain-containing protein [Streptomyces lavendulocolor]|uniref:helix-turn-helix domain-containing protein n=1 Tax=Streptomyces lavendulocolor TaxID=67316 RepID=UPI003C2C29FB